MKRQFLILLFGLFLLPLTTFASCVENGATIVYVNGIFGTKESARADLSDLRTRYEVKIGKNTGVDFINGYNPSHLGGVGDIAESITQFFGGSLSDYDLNTILMQIEPEVTTRKVLLVGHSQGSFYTNAMYDYLLSHGEPKEAVGVYNVGTPAHYTAGDGGYITAKQDVLVSMVANNAQKIHAPLPLPPNADIPISAADATSQLPGHQFATAYLSGAPDRIVGDISQELNSLTPSLSSDKGTCFDAPTPTLGYKTQQVSFSVADPAASALHAGFDVVSSGAIALAHTAVSVAQAAVGALGQAINAIKNSIPGTTSTLTNNTVTQKNFTVTKVLYGSSLSTKDVQSLLSSDQGAAVVLATQPSVPGEVLGVQTGPDTVPQTDMPPPKSQTLNPIWSGGGNPVGGVVADATLPQPSVDSSVPLSVPSPVPIVPPPTLFSSSSTAPTVHVDACVDSLVAGQCVLSATEVTVSWSSVEDAVEYHVLLNGVDIKTTTDLFAVVTLSDQTNTTISVAAHDANHTALVSDPVTAITYTHPLLINEINWAGSLAVPTNQWIELKNTTPFTLNLSHITLVGTGGEYIPLSGTISPQTATKYSGFYLIENNGELFSSDTRPGDLTTPLSLSATGEQFTLLLSTPTGTTTVDQTPAVSTCSGWCAGTAAHVIGSSLPGETGVPPNTLSMERASAADGTLSTSWHSNDTYTQNGVYSFGVTSLPTYGTPGSENSVGEPADYGFFCSPDTLSIVPNQTYTPHSSHCTYLARFLGFPVTLSAALFKGTPGNATLVNLHTFVNQEHGGGIDTIVGNPGDTFFTALWQQRQYTPNDDTYFTSYFTTGQYVDGGTQDVIAEPPHALYQTLPFVLGE